MAVGVEWDAENEWIVFSDDDGGVLRIPASDAFEVHKWLTGGNLRADLSVTRVLFHDSFLDAVRLAHLDRPPSGQSPCLCGACVRNLEGEPMVEAVYEFTGSALKRVERVRMWRIEDPAPWISQQPDGVEQSVDVAAGELQPVINATQRHGVLALLDDQ